MSLRGELTVTNLKRSYGFATDGVRTFYFNRKTIEREGHDFDLIDVGDHLDVSYRAPEGDEQSHVVTFVFKVSPPRVSHSCSALKHSGDVVWYSAEKGYGFIRTVGQPDIFVHAKALKRSDVFELDKGQPVRYSTKPSEKGGLEVDRLELVITAEAVVEESTETQLELDLLQPAATAEPEAVGLSKRRRRPRLSKSRQSDGNVEKAEDLIAA